MGRENDRNRISLIYLLINKIMKKSVSLCKCVHFCANICIFIPQIYMSNRKKYKKTIKSTGTVALKIIIYYNKNICIKQNQLGGGVEALSLGG